MKTIIKIVAALFILIIALIVGLVILGLAAVDKAAVAAVEYGGQYAMGVETTVDTMDVGLAAGTVEIGGLNIANPSGFETANFFTLANTFASIDLNSIKSDTIVVPSVKLSGIDVTLDKGNDPSNYNQILENLKKFESGESAPVDDKKAGKNVVIKSLILEDINIHLANMPGVELLAGDVAINIPQIELQNIGEEDNMKAGDIFNLVIKTVMAAAVEAGGGIIPGDVLGELGNGLAGLSSLSDMGINAISDLNLDGALGQVGEQLNQAANDLGNAVDDAVSDVADDLGNAVDDAANDVKDKMKNIFGGNKDD